MQNGEWIKVFETFMPHQATIVQSILREHNIHAVILNQQDSSYIIMGEISVYVALKDFEEAMGILRESADDEQA